MKLLIILISTLFSSATFAQRSDTLTIPIGKYKFIKIGDKVYKLDINLVEVKEGRVFLGLTVDTTGVVDTMSIRSLWPYYSPTLQPLHGDTFKNY
jgi:hypothetical protein